MVHSQSNICFAATGSTIDANNGG